MVYNIKRLYKGFWQLADPKIWVASTVPMLVGASLAYSSTGEFEVFWFLISLIGVYFIEIGKNAFNEVIDYRSGVDRWVKSDKSTPFSGGKKTIIQGKLTVIEAGVIAVLTIGAACVIGIYLMFFREMSIFWIGIAGVIISIAYSVPPFKLAYRGLGEIAVGLTYGPLILSGIYLIMTKTLNFNVLIVSFPIGLLISNVLWINQYPDYEADKQGRKRNWVVRLGKKNALLIYKILFALAYAFFPLLSLIYKNPVWMLGLVSVPIAVRAIKVSCKHYDNVPRLVEANMKTIITYQITGLAMVIAALLSK